MKTYGAFLILGFISTSSLAKSVNFEQFNKKLVSEIDTVLEDNPEVYEQNTRGRFPASVPSKVDTTTKKLDEVAEQASGQKSW